MSTNTYQQELESFQQLERAQTLHDQMPAYMFGGLTIPFFAATILWPHYNHVYILIWFSTVSLLALSRWPSALRLKSAIVTPDNCDAYIKNVVIWSSITGFAWGLQPIIFNLSDQPTSGFLLTLAYTAYISVAVPSLGIYFKAFFGFAFCSSAMGLGLRLYNEQYGSAFTVISYISVMTYFARSRSIAFDKTTRLTFENQKLMSEVVEQKENVENAMKAKNQFLAAASHDLRQPLHALGLFIEALNARKLDETTHNIIGKVSQSAQALNGLLHGLLDISRLDANVVKNIPGNHPLNPLLEVICNEYEERASDKQLSIVLESEESLYVYIDLLLLERVIRNLIDNAVKFTPNGSVHINAKISANNKVEINISDTGIGIPHEQGKMIFSEFTQLNNPERDRTKGLGLGLAIVKRLCELTNIKVEMTSTVGKGTSFNLHIPAGGADLITTRPKQKSDLMRGTVILVIDDETDILDGMRQLLQQWGAIAITATNSGEAVDTLHQLQLQPRLIIADFRLRNDANGIDVIKEVRDEFNEEIDAILITGDTSPDRLLLAQSSELSIMYKPVDPHSLREQINQFLSKESQV